MRTRRSGFTLIELLIVVVIIGILAAIAIPKFGATRDKANEASLKSDLRNLLSAQETYYSNNTNYMTEVNLADSTLWLPSTGSTADVVPTGTTMFAATVTKAGRKCTMTFYAQPTAASATNNGAITCTAA